MLYQLAQVGCACLPGAGVGSGRAGATRPLLAAVCGTAPRSAKPACRSPSLCFSNITQEGFRPAKYFSIDRVFRNEAIDRTHLAEFHQIEGGLVRACPPACVPLLGSPASHVLCTRGWWMGAYGVHARASCTCMHRLVHVCLSACAPPVHATGVVCDYGLTLSDLIGTLQQFFDR